MKQTKTTSFWALMVTQFFGAFNDNVFQIVTALLVIRWMDESSAKKWVAASGVVFAAPFLIFSLGAGRLADRWSKARIIVLTKSFDLLIVAIAIGGMYLESVPLLFAGLFFLALQSTFFSPAKYGILPELKTENELSQANGLLNMATFVAILTGTIAGTFLIGNIHAVALTMGLVAVGSFVGGLFIEKVPAANPNQKLRWNPWPDFFGNWKLISGSRPLRLSLLAVSYFWFVGGVLHLNTLVYVKQTMHLSDRVSGILLTALVIGIALGSLAAGKLSKDKVELGLVPVGAVGTSLFILDMYFSHGSVIRTVFDAFMIGLSSGVYVIPLNTLIQLRSPDTERGRVLATANFLSFIAILLASGFLWLMGSVFKANPAHVFLALGLLSISATAAILFYLPQALIRLTLYFFTNLVYRLKVMSHENVPVNGPALLVPNHVSMIDPFLVAGGISRQVRFLMFRDFYEKPLIHPFVKLMNAIPISNTDSPKEIMMSLLAARRQLAEGHLVCIFAEGEISRLGGAMLGFKRGLEVILKDLDVPIVPVHLEGVWGSIFSFQKKKFIWKWPKKLPYPVTLTFGKPLRRAGLQEIRQAVMDLGVDAFAAHHEHDPTPFESFLIETKSTLFHGLLAEAVLVGKRLANAVKPEAKNIGVLLPPSADAALAHVALASQGFVSVNLNEEWPAKTVEDICRDAGVTTILTPEELLKLRAQIGSAEKRRMEIFLRFLPSGLLRRMFFQKSAKNLDELAALVFTLDAVGNRKGVMLTHGNIRSHIQALARVLQKEPVDVWLQALAGFKIAPLEAYGCTELSGVAALNVPDIADGDVFQIGRKAGTVGRPLPGVSVRIVDPKSFAPVETGTAGLLLVKGPNVMKGYWNDPKKTAEVMRNGWYVTGDLATFDDDGFIEIQGGV